MRVEYVLSVLSLAWSGVWPDPTIIFRELFLQYARSASSLSIFYLCGDRKEGDIGLDFLDND